MLDRGQPGRDPSPPSEKSQKGLDWFAFFLADVQVGFGPFLSIYLTTNKWTNADIGIVLSIGAVIGLLAQIPGGAFIDALRRDRLVAMVAMIAIGISALWIAASPVFLSVVLAQVLHVGASVLVGPALAAMSLGLVGYAMLGERIGRNARFASLGSIVAGLSMGLIGKEISSQAVFVVAAVTAIPAIIALSYVAPKELQHGHRAQPAAEKFELGPILLDLLKRPPLLILAASIFFFHLANAAVLPLVASTITVRVGESATLLIAMAMIVPQLIVAAASPLLGNAADEYGRRPFLLAGLAALPVRAVLLAMTTDPYALIAIQLLDGISATCLGVIVATSAADIARGKGTFNVALGIIGTAMGIGAAISTYVAGVLADNYGTSVTLLTLSVCGLLGFLLCAALMPETKSSHASEA